MILYFNHLEDYLQSNNSLTVYSIIYNHTNIKALWFMDNRIVKNKNVTQIKRSLCL